MRHYRSVLHALCGVCLLVLATAPTASAADNDPFKDPKDLHQLAAHMLWKSRQNYPAGQFYFTEACKNYRNKNIERQGGGTRAFPLLLLSSGEKTPIKPKYVAMSESAANKRFIAGAYAFDKKGAWSFTVADASKGLEDKDFVQLGEALRDFLYRNDSLTVRMMDGLQGPSFRAQCKKERSEENLDFCQACDKFCEKPSSDGWVAIYTSYIMGATSKTAQTATTPVNLDQRFIPRLEEFNTNLTAKRTKPDSVIPVLIEARVYIEQTLMAQGAYKNWKDDKKATPIPLTVKVSRGAK